MWLRGSREGSRGRHACPDPGRLANDGRAGAGPAECRSQILPIDPYVLGAWIASDVFHEQRAVVAAGRVGDNSRIGIEIPHAPVRSGIPRKYLGAGIEQRRALLAGIMDARGEVDERGCCRVGASSLDLAADYRELVASLGHEPRAIREVHQRHELRFTPHEIVFRLPGKVARQKLLQRFHMGRDHSRPPMRT